MSHCYLVWLVVALGLWTASEADAVDHVTIKRNGREQVVSGKIEVAAVDGGVLLLAADGELWAIQPEEVVSKKSDETPFASLTREQMNKLLLEQHPGFKLHSTAHYTICYNTSPGYAQWVGGLYERLYDAFYNFWNKRGLELREPELPLVAVVFDTRDNYALFAREELGEAVTGIIGYYSLRSNQVIMYDLTGIEGLGVKGKSNGARINAILSQPTAERNVATIVHEATHQLVFNSGMQARYADIPFWVSEGLAVYFETPDLDSAKGWKKIGGINRYNLLQFRKWLKERPDNTLDSLLIDDKRFRNTQTAAAAYGEAWAFNYFLLRTRSDEYATYLKKLKELEAIVALEPQQRITMFKAAFGDDLKKLDAEFLKYMRNVN